MFDALFFFFFFFFFFFTGGKVTFGNTLCTFNSLPSGDSVVPFKSGNQKKIPMAVALQRFDWTACLETDPINGSNNVYMNLWEANLKVRHRELPNRVFPAAPFTTVIIQMGADKTCVLPRRGGCSRVPCRRVGGELRAAWQHGAHAGTPPVHVWWVVRRRKETMTALLTNGFPRGHPRRATALNERLPTWTP